MIFVEKDSTEQFSRQARFWKGPRLPWTNSWETSSLWFPHPVSPSPLCSECLCTACSKTYKLAEKFPLSFFWFIALIALVLGATGRLFGRFWKCDLQKQEKLLSTVFGRFGSCGEIFPWKPEVCRTVLNRSGGLQNRSEPFWRPLRQENWHVNLFSVPRIPGVGRHGQGWTIPDAVVPAWK